MTYRVRRTFGLAVLLLAAAVGAASPAHAASFTVNSLGDAADANPGNGVCATGGGVCTLRAALQEANALGGTTTIGFSVTGTITLGSTLPTITATNANIAIVGPGPKATSLTVQGNDTFTLLYVSGSGTNLTISELAFTKGFASLNAAAIEFDNAGTLTLNDSEIYGNAFGGLNVVVYSGGATAISFNRSSIHDNGTGGNAVDALETDGAALALTNCTFASNHVGLYIDSGTVTVSSSTFWDNSGGGIWNVGDTGAVSTTLSNTILSQNGGLNLRKSATSPNTMTSGGHDVVDDASYTTLDATGPGDLLGSTYASQVRLLAIADNGGPTRTVGLLKSSAGDSVAIDAGGNSGAPATDERGVARPVNGTVDIGAFEYDIDLSPTTLPSGALNVAYAPTALTASGGTGPYAFAIAGGALPNGMGLSGGGSLSGTPTQSGSFAFTVTATDAGGFVSARGYTLIVSATPVELMRFSAR